MITSAWKVIAGSHVLLDYACRYNYSSFYLPSCVSVQKYSQNANYEDHNPIRLGWIGSESTLKQLDLLEKPFQYLLLNHYDFEFFVAGTRKLCHGLSNIPDLRMIEIPEYDDDDLPSLVKEIDIGLMPLFDTPSEQGKCGLKAIIYMAGGIPTICSPVGAALTIIQNGKNGYLAETKAEWGKILANLIDDIELRKRI